MDTQRVVEARECECEHIAHFEYDERTPHGNPGHYYGRKFHPNALTNVGTDYGHFWVCKDCATDCLREILPELYPFRVSCGSCEQVVESKDFEAYKALNDVCPHCGLRITVEV